MGGSDGCHFVFSQDIVPSASYDLILGSEVLYFVNAYTKLIDIMQRCLRPTGKAYVQLLNSFSSNTSLIASKLYYFSCGGGTRQFEEVTEKQGAMQCRVLKRIEDQQSNIREILELQLTKLVK